MNLDRVSEHFEEEALDYDRSILRLVPHYHEQHAVMLSLLPFERSRPLRALDLGCGTGVLSHVLLKEFPNARVEAWDLAENMLERARGNLSQFSDRVAFRRANFGSDDLGTGYDVVVSGLAIHHLDDAGKRALYRRIFAALAPGGAFLNREIVTGATPTLTRLYEKWWRAFVAANGEKDDVWFEKYFAEDLPAPLESQLAWLSEAGFRDVACHWRWMSFAIFGGTKPI
jgi:tRNA (cmo5U34)-methyltransferase